MRDPLSRRRLSFCLIRHAATSSQLRTGKTGTPVMGRTGPSPRRPPTLEWARRGTLRHRAWMRRLLRHDAYVAGAGIDGDLYLIWGSVEIRGLIGLAVDPGEGRIHDHLAQPG